MADKAVEIQKIMPKELGLNKVPLEAYAEFVHFKNNGLVVWLPRQDQLQEMLGEFLNNTMLCFCKWFIGDSIKYGMKLWTPEQYWLAFVMKEKYGKVWNGEDWVKGE